MRRLLLLGLLYGSTVLAQTGGGGGGGTGGGGSTITGITAGNGLTGGGTTGNVPIALTSPVTATNGGTGEAGTLTGLLYGNGTSAYTAATSSQVQTAIGSGVYDVSGAAANLLTTANTWTQNQTMPALLSSGSYTYGTLQMGTSTSGPLLYTTTTYPPLTLSSNSGVDPLDLQSASVSAVRFLSGGGAVFAGPLSTTSLTGTDAASLALPITNGYYRVTLTTNTTASIAAGTDGQRLCLDIKQGTSAFTFAFPASMHGSGTIGTTVSKDNVQCFDYNTAATAWLAEAALIQNE